MTRMFNTMKQISHVEMARRDILMRAFRAHQEGEPFPTASIIREHTLILYDMLRDGEIDQDTPSTYTITQRGIASWRRVVKGWMSSATNSKIARAVVDNYDRFGAPVTQEA